VKAKATEIELCEMALKSDYGSLRNDFGHLQATHATLLKDKENVEKVEREKARRFRNLLRRKLVGLRLEMENQLLPRGRCFEFLAANAMPTAFAECNQNITCYVMAGILKKLVGVECGYLPELRELAMSCDASILHGIPKDIARIVRRLVRNWWTSHGLPYYMQRTEEDNRVSFAPISFVVREFIKILLPILVECVAGRWRCSR
jgi:hypothetical protein